MTESPGFSGNATAGADVASVTIRAQAHRRRGDQSMELPLLSHVCLVVGDTDRLFEEAARLSGLLRRLRIGFTTAIYDCLLECMRYSGA